MLALILALPLLTSCSYDKMLDKLAPKEESALAQNYLEKLRNNDIASIKEQLSSELITPDIDTKLSEVANYFPKGEPIAIKLIGANTLTSPGKWQANLSYQYQFEKGWALADILLVKENGKLTIKGIHVNQLSESLKKINAFNFNDKSIIHYLFLPFAVLIPIFILYSLISCIRTPMEKRKWLWIIFIIIGFMGFSLNWTTGQIATKLFNIQLFGVAALAASPYAPWVITVSFPLGALIFLLRRKSLIKQEPITTEKVNNKIDATGNKLSGFSSAWCPCASFRSFAPLCGAHS